ncbi:hypothetical protein VTN00DRAFT_8814 [Thermoascus crustaceus]|uniref:uncharacterized protein n=1 Tax=Thermoascus crustaceus TaxID=5088 RepID=UPI00374218F1
MTAAGSCRIGAEGHQVRWQHDDRKTWPTTGKGEEFGGINGQVREDEDALDEEPPSAASAAADNHRQLSTWNLQILLSSILAYPGLRDCQDVF